MPDTQSNKAALILGASSGFGRAVSLDLAANGYDLYGVHLDRAAGLEQVEKLKEQIEAFGVQAAFFNVNAADDSKREDVISAVREAMGGESDRISLLLHSLAFGTLRPFIPADGEPVVSRRQLEMTLDVMANSLVYWVQDLWQAGLLGDGSTVLAMTSSGSRRVLPAYGAVSAAKAALESYCRQLAFELGPYGVTANAIEAGVTDTPALRKIPGSQRLLEDARKRNPLKRLTEPEEIARVVTAFANSDLRWINGTTVTVDGGESSVEIDWRQADQT
jgi:NAD(P)-dependent dehydrogenase (short-subunit alcohol dehydrogenase family)